MMAAAPACAACAAKLMPSALVPGTATNRSPRFTARLSAVIPPISSAPPRALSEAWSVRSSESFIVAVVVERAAPQHSQAPPARPMARPGPCRQNFQLLLDLGQKKLVGRRQIKARLDAEHRRDAGDHLAGGRPGVPARGRKAMRLRQALRLVEHDQDLIARLVGWQDRGERGQQLGLGVAAAAHLFPGAGLAPDVVG